MNTLTSRKGFTLTELLIVVGILAVLAAIAIPTVAGLIDRANKSADQTNASEYTNAMERFVSEYEMFRQDVASGTFDKNNMDATQSRIYNIIGIEKQMDIANIEVDDDAIVAENSIAIRKNTKYPANTYTALLIVETYFKATSSVFEPKQSDMHYWYSPECGTVILAKANADIVNDLNSQILSGKDVSGKDLSSATKWIDITNGKKLQGIGYAVFDDGVTLTWDEIQDEKNGEKYGYHADYISNTAINMCAFCSCDRLISINIPSGITHIGQSAFDTCANLKDVTFDGAVHEIKAYAFGDCYSLTTFCIPTGIRELHGTFFASDALTTVYMPNTVNFIDFETFAMCYSLRTIYYDGSMNEWNAITKDSGWGRNLSSLKVVCDDGTIDI